MALQITQHLVLQHEYACPVTLTMIVSSLLIHEQNNTVPLDALYRNSIKLYDYIIKRGQIKMIMTQPPSKRDVTETVLKLGFKTKPIQAKLNNKSKKPKFEVSLERKKDQKVLLGLSYYANNLIQNMMMDTCIGRLLDIHQF